MEFSEARTARPLHLAEGNTATCTKPEQMCLSDGIMRTQVMTSFTFTPNGLNLDQDSVEEFVGIARI